MTASTLAANRAALLEIASQVCAQDLVRETRNAGWSVADVLAHVLASDADLISLLASAAQTGAADRRHEDHARHEQEMKRWKDAAPPELIRALRERSDRWWALLNELPDGWRSTRARAWWVDADRLLGDIIDDFRDHDAQHAEDVRLALQSC